MAAPVAVGSVAVTAGPAPTASFVVGIPPAFAAMRMRSAGMRLRTGSTFATFFVGGFLVARRREFSAQLRKYFLQHDGM
jgi:hypothetical protein